MENMKESFSGEGIPEAMAEACSEAYNAIFETHMFDPDTNYPIANLVDWLAREAGFDRTTADNYVRSCRKDPHFRRAASGDPVSRYYVAKMIGTMTGIKAFHDADSFDEVKKACAANAGRPVDEAAEVSGEAMFETVKYIEGHKNSKGEDAPWTIVSCKNGKILSSHTSKTAAAEHLQQMEYYKHKKS